jgi:hypothetical protein
MSWKSWVSPVAHAKHLAFVGAIHSDASRRGIHAIFHSPPASELLSLAWPRAKRRVTKEKATPLQRSPGSATAPALLSTACSRRGSTASIHEGVPPASMQSSCPATAQRDSGGSPTVHPWTGVELGAIHCAHPAGFLGNCSCVALPPASMQSPTSRCRCIGDPVTAHPAQPRRSGFPQPRAFALLSALARTTRAQWAPSIAARLRRECPKDGPHDVGQFDASPGMDCRRTPERPRAPGAQGLCARRDRGVAFLLVTSLWPRKEKPLARRRRVKKGTDAARRRRVLWMCKGTE